MNGSSLVLKGQRAKVHLEFRTVWKEVAKVFFWVNRRQMTDVLKFLWAQELPKRAI
jgi:hypothetical protein